YVRIGVGEGLRRRQVGELGNDDAAGEAGGPGILRIDGGHRPGKQEAPLLAQCLQARQVRLARRQTLRQGIGRITSEDQVPHGHSATGSGDCNHRPARRRRGPAPVRGAPPALRLDSRHHVPPMPDTMTAADAARDLVTRYYSAFNRGDWEGMLALLDEGVAHDLNQGPRETGREAFRAFLQRMARCYRERLEDIVVMATPDGRRAGAEYVVH